ncbi:hypothetical protein SH2C18_16560 [Clostridium sediminicola]|uniref:Spo0E family sporulation regulatory protein-aspartic acid phosphatase n=1 Tax=Clostridium sediminicola TaxID=3114879 RepID=UPI0031F1FA27
MVSNKFSNRREVDNIKKEIERVRLLLNTQVSSNYKKCLDPEVIKLSQYLDKLLNDYFKCSH